MVDPATIAAAFTGISTGFDTLKKGLDLYRDARKKGDTKGQEEAVQRFREQLLDLNDKVLSLRETILNLREENLGLKEKSANDARIYQHTLESQGRDLIEVRAELQKAKIENDVEPQQTTMKGTNCG